MKKILNIFFPSSITWRARVERMRYQNNKLGQNLALLAVLANIFAIFVMYESRMRPGLFYGFDVVINILFLLFGFWASERLKSYDARWGFAVIMIAILEMFRGFFVPFYYLHGNVNDTWRITLGLAQQIHCWYLISGIILTLAGVVTIVRAKRLSHFLTPVEQTQKANPDLFSLCLLYGGAGAILIGCILLLIVTSFTYWMAVNAFAVLLVCCCIAGGCYLIVTKLHLHLGLILLIKAGIFTLAAGQMIATQLIYNHNNITLLKAVWMATASAPLLLKAAMVSLLMIGSVLLMLSVWRIYLKSYHDFKEEEAHG